MTRTPMSETVSVVIQFIDFLTTKTWNEEFYKHAACLNEIAANPNIATGIQKFSYSAPPITSHAMTRIQADSAVQEGYALLMSCLANFLRACHNLRFIYIHSAIFDQAVAASIQQLGHLEEIELRAAEIYWNTGHQPLEVQKVHMSCGESRAGNSVHHFKFLSLPHIRSLQLEDARLGRTLNHLVAESGPYGHQELINLQVEITSNKLAKQFIQLLEYCPRLENLVLVDSRTQKPQNPFRALSPGALPQLATYSGPSDIARLIIAQPRPIHRLTLDSRVETKEDALGVLYDLQPMRRPLPRVSILQVFTIPNIQRVINSVRPHLGKVNGLRIRFKSDAEVPDMVYRHTLPVRVRWVEDVTGYWLCELLNT